MNPNIKQKFFSYFVLLILTLSMLYPSSVALADDTPPPPEETQEPTPPPEETEEPVSPPEETEEPVSPPEETQEPVAPQEDPSPTLEVFPVETLTNEDPPELEVYPTETPVVDDLPELQEFPIEDSVEAEGEPEAPAEGEDTEEVSLVEVVAEAAELGIVLADNSGEPLELSTVEATEALGTGDPYFVRGGTTFHFYQNAGDCALNGYGADLDNTCFEAPNAIQAAIDNVAANGAPDPLTTSDGVERQTIFVEAGTYEEQVVIRDLPNLVGITLWGNPGSLTLPGAGPDAPVLDGSNLTGTTTGITINAYGVSIIGFVIQNYDTGIYHYVVSGNSPTYILNNDILNNGVGIQMEGGQGKPGTEVHYNVFDGNDTALVNTNANNVQFIEAQNNYWGCPQGPIIAYEKFQGQTSLGTFYRVWASPNIGGPNNNGEYTTNPYPDCEVLDGYNSLWDHQIKTTDYSPFKINLGTLVVPGCIDETANNYNPDATVDDGSCTYDVYGCTDPEANNYDPNATVDDESCTYDVLGCTDPEANNYDPNATVDDQSCTYDILGCTDPEATNYDPEATVNDGSCVFPPEPVPGCTNPLATNYNPEATVDDGSCVFPPELVPGCTNPLATNYNPEATVDDGSCVFPPEPVPGCTNPLATNYNPNATVDDGSCVYPPVPVPGCTDPLATNYNPNATVDDGSCVYPPVPVPGCTDPEATNYNPEATVDDGSCVYPPEPVPGCTDPEATNYNPKATVDDGSCVYPVALGCTDPFALNYSSSAIIDDGSCRYPLTPPEPPVLVTSFIPVTGGEPHAIAAGIAHTCAITPEGGVQCWGNNDYGQLGNGTYTSSNIRVDVTGLLGATTIVAGGNHTCVLSGSDVWCWGQNSSGQLGDGTTADRNVPVKVLSGVVDITAGYDFTCATLLNGEAMCWGNNDKGQIASGGQAVYPSPTLAKLMSGLSQIDAGRNKNCGLTPAGLVRCVSGNTSEELGETTGTNLNVAVNRFGPSVIALNDQGVPIQFLYGEPRMVNQLSAVQDIDSGFGHICALQSTGSVECWGANNYGQLGNNSKDRSADPVAVQNLYSAWQLAVGRNHTCVMTITNEPGDPGIQCWGLNTDGQLGDGTNETSLVPVKVK